MDKMRRRKGLILRRIDKIRRRKSDIEQRTSNMGLRKSDAREMIKKERNHEKVEKLNFILIGRVYI